MNASLELVFILLDVINSGFINPLQTKHRPLYLRPSSYRAVNTFHLGYKTNQFMS